MAYECEENIKHVIKELVYFKNGKDELANKEIDEIYTKAKAFDKVLELHSQNIDTSSIYGSDLPLSANRYEYYDDGLFAYEIYTLIKNYLEDE